MAVDDFEGGRQSPWTRLPLVGGANAQQKVRRRRAAPPAERKWGRARRPQVGEQAVDFRRG